MGETDISWTHRPGTVGRSWNPGQGCSLVSEGCRNCYAMRLAARFAESGWSKGLINLKTKKWNGTVRLVPHKLADPLSWRKPSTVFANSMTDLFHDGYSNEQIAAVFGVMAACPQHTFQVLTKRARRMREWFEWVAAQPSRVAETPPSSSLYVTVAAYEALDQDLRVTDQNVWPLPNVWLGVSVENQAAADERVPELRNTPAAIRFLSCEPLLGPVNIERHLLRNSQYPHEWKPPLDWVIAGCEHAGIPRADLPRLTLEEVRAHTVVCEHNPLVRERDLLAKNVAALTEDVAKQRAVIETLTKERDEATTSVLNLRTGQALARQANEAADTEIGRLRDQLAGIRLTFRDLSADCHKGFGGGYKVAAESEIFHHGMETVCKNVEAALARHDAEPVESQHTMRADYLAAHLRLVESGVPVPNNGREYTVADRVKLLAASRDEMAKRFAAAEKERDAAASMHATATQNAVNAKAAAEYLRKTRDTFETQLGRLQPLRHVLRSWDWQMLLEDERIPDEAVMPLLRAFATVEREENQAAKTKEANR
jgi:protein gp37